MTQVIGTIVAIAGLVAVAAWLTAVYSAIQVIRLVPRGKRLGAWFTLGWWQFEKLRALGGPGVEPHLKRYVQGFLGFFAAILVSMVLGGLAAVSAQNGQAPGQAASDPRRINDPRVIAVAGADEFIVTQTSVLES
jgi:hypothetical protein